MTTFYAVPTRSTRIRVIFSEPMQKNAALLNRTQYTVTDMSSGAAFSVSSVTAEQATHVISTVLDLGLALVGGRSYQVKIPNTLIVSESGGVLSPNMVVFRWVEGALSAQIPISQFSGEVAEGLYGDLPTVFFSPALQNPAPNSVIQVDQVDVCTRADDAYQIPPQSENFKGLLVHGYTAAGVLIPAPPTPATSLNSTDVLSVPASRSDVRYAVGLKLTDTVLPPVDGSATATLVAWPPERIALLNVDAAEGWKLFDHLGGTKAYFITADNLTPLAPGSPVTRTL